MTDTGRTIQGMVNYDHLAPMETSGVFSTAPGDGNGYNMSVTSPNYGPTNFTIDAGLMWGSDHVGSAFAPEHVLLPVILYLGLHTCILIIARAFPGLGAGDGPGGGLGAGRCCT